MNKTLAITAIALVAVVMGLSTISPMMQYAYASHGGPDLPDDVCDILRDISDPPDRIVQIIAEHCGSGAGCPPSCGGVVGSTIF